MPSRSTTLSLGDGGVAPVSEMQPGDESAEGTHGRCRSPRRSMTTPGSSRMPRRRPASPGRCTPGRGGCPWTDPRHRRSGGATSAGSASGGDSQSARRRRQGAAVPTGRRHGPSSDAPANATASPLRACPPEVSVAASDRDLAASITVCTSPVGHVKPHREHWLRRMVPARTAALSPRSPCVYPEC